MAQPTSEPGMVVIRVSGADAMFGFSSFAPPLNLHLASVGGLAESQPITLRAGEYRIGIDDLSGMGMSVRAVDCSDDNSRGDRVSGSAELVLDPCELLICTFSVTSAPERAAALIESPVPARGTCCCPACRRARIVSTGSREQCRWQASPQRFMNALPGIVAGRPIPVAASLGAF
ncbi:hypothetical protein N8D56_11835 [Devosia sp. A8/3-2]|nr:hypothetical protein N8D56_11835 [Devosia sp. A8/3-2]